MGAVLHQLNIRLFPDQLAFVVNDGGDRVVIVEEYDSFGDSCFRLKLDRTPPANPQ
jgi:acyl-CoA synthetase (AMP-forming)/AMP-acid ligase II